MIKYIKNNTDWKEIRNACRTTVGAEETDAEITNNFKKRLLLSEHSPIRLLNITWLWQGIKSWISVHFVRHKYGIEHFVSSQREDRTGIDRDSKRQDSLVNHKCNANAQAIIYISRKRLCKKAHPETREAWREFLYDLYKHEPELVDCCVPECIYRGGICPELKTCGYNLTDNFKQELDDYIKPIQSQVRFNIKKNI